LLLLKRYSIGNLFSRLSLVFLFFCSFFLSWKGKQWSVQILRPGVTSRNVKLLRRWCLSNSWFFWSKEFLVCGCGVWQETSS
jgi:hypothetical protein